MTSNIKFLQQLPFLFCFFTSSLLFSTTPSEIYLELQAAIQTLDDNRVEIVSSTCGKKEKYCEGRCTYKDGSIYEGQFRFGLPHGKGVMTWNNGSRYDGQFQGGYRHGKGQQLLDDGSIYEGEWQIGFMNGMGEYSFACGHVYKGSFIEDQMHGKGKIVMANGESYEGEWKDNVASGEGTYILVDGTRHLGKYRKGKRNGKGVITWITGDAMIGSWRDGKAHKSSEFKFSNGDHMICNWDRGQIDGDLTYVFSEEQKEVSGSLLAIERQLSEQEELLEKATNNIALSWYAIALELKMDKKFKAAKDVMKKAQEYLPPSSDLNKLIHQQLKIIELDMLNDNS